MKVGLVNIIFFRTGRKNVDLNFTFFCERILIDSKIVWFWNTWFSVFWSSNWNDSTIVSFPPEVEIDDDDEDDQNHCCS